MKLIGINGFKESGKDTTFKCIEQVACERESVAVRRAFADKLKVMAAKALGYEGTNEELIEKMNLLKDDGGYVDSGYVTAAPHTGLPIIANTRISGRKYLQLFGGRAREVFGDTFWIDLVLPSENEVYSFDSLDRKTFLNYGLLESAIEQRFEKGVDYACVTDVRYPNEAERIFSLGGQVWEIVNPRCVSDGDASEQPLPREFVTVTIHNDGSIADLRRMVEAVL